MVRPAADSRNCSCVGDLRPEMRALETLTSVTGCRDAAELPAAFGTLEQVTAPTFSVTLTHMKVYLSKK